MQDIFEIKPQLPGYEKSGPEPDLREIVFKYYNKYFTYEKSIKLTEEYIAQLIKQYKEI